MPDGRVLIAFDDTALEPSPGWIRVDNVDGVACNQIEIRRGRQTEFDVTEASTASVFFIVPALIMDRDSRGIHDRASRTVVIRTR